MKYPLLSPESDVPISIPALDVSYHAQALQADPDCSTEDDRQEEMLCRISGSRNSGHGEFYRLGYNAVLFIESQLMFRANIFASFSGSKNKPSGKHLL
jgi:hypothetical protein